MCLFLCLSALQISAKVASVSTEHRDLVGRYRREMALRRRLHNTLVELRGNIRVLCRVRPTIAEVWAWPCHHLISGVGVADTFLPPAPPRTESPTWWCGVTGGTRERWVCGGEESGGDSRWTGRLAASLRRKR